MICNYAYLHSMTKYFWQFFSADNEHSIKSWKLTIIFHVTLDVLLFSVTILTLNTILDANSLSLEKADFYLFIVDKLLLRFQSFLSGSSSSMQQKYTKHWARGEVRLQVVRVGVWGCIFHHKKPKTNSLSVACSASILSQKLHLLMCFSPTSNVFAKGRWGATVADQSHRHFKWEPHASILSAPFSSLPQQLQGNLN